jgi:tetratricopeptide (TPR) repeat protein
MSVGALDLEAAEKLAALGYVGAGAGAPDAPAGGRKDPKDVIGVFNRLRRANSAVRDRRFDEALPILRDVLAEDQKNAFARLVMGSAFMGMGRPREAIAWYGRYLEIVPTSSYAHQWMAICHVRLGDKEAALREADAALAIDPHFTDARVLKGGVLASRGAYDAALRELRLAVETDPAKGMLRLDLAKVLAEAGRLDEALAVYDGLLQRQPDYAPALIGLGTLQAKRGDLEGAERSLRRSLELDPSQDDARFDLARVVEQRGRPDEAASEYRRLLDAPHTAAAVREAARRRLAGLGR